MRRHSASNLIITLGLPFLLMGCVTDYQISTRDPEIVYITEEVEVEVPVYIEVEVPGDPAGDIWVDSFDQPYSVDGVDILWVIDTSGSMYRYEPELLIGIAAMLAALPESGWRLAMTSNSPDKAVTEAQFPLVPGDDIDDATDMYNAMLVGHSEEGFDASYEYIVNNSYASTWMRSDAALLVVLVSDEEDQSNNYFSLVSDFTSWYGSLRGGSVFLASIINLDSAESVCATSPNPIDVGDRYMEATTHFAGTIVDICSDDWSAGVAEASSQVEPYEEWPLSYIPHPDTIRVFIDAQLNTDWTYDSPSNSVLFTVIPPAGTHVEIGYIIDADGNTDTGDDDDSGDSGN